MKLIDIRNNLAKISYTNEEPMALGRFIAIVDESHSYVAQIVNLKADTSTNFAIAKLIFNFNSDGIVDCYDGSIPSLSAELSYINAQDILKLLPMETPVTIGRIAQQDEILRVDESIYEQNLLICAEKYEHINILINNAAAGLSKKDEKIVIIDTDNNFADLKSLRCGIDFKIPLNYQMFDYLYESCLEDIDTSGRAVIQEVLYDVQEYSKTAPHEFIPFNKFLNVVSNQYEVTRIPELAILAKTLRHQDSNLFAEDVEEVDKLINTIKNNQLTYINISNIADNLQKEIISYIHSVLDKSDDYVYLFVKLTNHNSNKKLLKQIVTNEHIFANIICSHNYKYVSELKQRASNVILFVPQTYQHDFACYNTFLSKLNHNEFIIYGDLTQNIPFIIELAELSQDEFNKEIEEEELKDNNIEQNNETTKDEEEILTVENFEPQEAEVFETENNDTFDELLENNNVISPQENILEEAFDNNVDENYTISEDALNELSIDEIPNDNYIENNEDTTENIEVYEDTQVQNNIEVQTPETDLPNIEQTGTDELNTENTFNATNTEVAGINEVDEVYYTEANESQTSNRNLSEDDLDFIDNLSTVTENSNEEVTNINEDITNDIQNEIQQNVEQIMPDFETENNDVYNENNDLPVYPTENVVETDLNYVQGDKVTHPKYGTGVVEKLIKYGNKTLCSIAFEQVGKRLLDPSISELQKINS